MKRITVFIVDDHAILRMGLASLLGTQNEIEVIGDAGDGESAIRKILKLRPDIVLMDLMMPEMDGVTATRRLLEKWPEAKVLALTSACMSDTINAVLQAGARGAVLKTLDFADLVDAITRVHAGKRALSAEIERILEEDPPVAGLSPRQAEMLDCIVRGLSNTDISTQFGISKTVVKEHLNALYGKLGAANRTEAVAIALRKHLLKEM